MKILIIDNDVSTTTTLSALLKSKGDFIIDTAHDGQEGLNKMSVNDYDLVLLDIMMPKVSGYDVCQAMIGDEKLKNIPVFLMSSALPLPADVFYKNLEDFSKFDLVKAVFEKPFNVDDLVDKINGL